MGKVWEKVKRAQQKISLDGLNYSSGLTVPPGSQSIEAVDELPN